MIDYEPNCGFESNSIAFGFEIIWQHEAPINLDKLMDCFDVITYKKRYNSGSSTPLPRDIFNNSAFEELVSVAYHEHIELYKNMPGLCVRARRAMSCNSYKKLVNNIRFLHQYSEDTYGLTLVLYAQSFNEDFEKNVEFCFDFVEHDKVRLLRTME